MYIIDNFNFLNSKQKKQIKENYIANLLLIFLSSMFEYKNIDINTDFLEYYMILGNYGAGVFETENKKKVVGYLTCGGSLDEYGVPKIYNAQCLNQTHKNNLIDEVNGVIFYNNKTHTSDLINVLKFSELLNLCDTSQKCLLKYSRLFPLFEVENSVVQNQIEKGLNNADNGDPITYVTRGLSKIDSNGNKAVEVINLGDINSIDKLQYLSMYHNELLKRFFSLYGMTINNTTKLSQQSVEEINKDDKTSFIIPFDKLKERKKAIEKYNKLYNTNASVDFSKAWLDAYENYKKGGDVNEL